MLLSLLQIFLRKVWLLFISLMTMHAQNELRVIYKIPKYIACHVVYSFEWKAYSKWVESSKQNTKKC